MARKTVNVMPPLAGLDRNWAYQSQAPFSLSDAINARCRDVFEQRQRLGCRGGHVKVYPQLLGGAIVTSYTVEFNYTLFDDTFLRDTSPTTNFVNDNLKIGVGVNTDYTVDRSILHFDLSSIPAGATIISASLAGTHGTVGTSLGGSAKVRRLTETTWVAAQATWNNKATATAWKTPNVKGTSFPESQTGPFTTAGELDWTMPTDTQGRIIIAGMGPLVQDAYTNRSKHLHIMLMMADETINDNGGFFRPSEYSIVADRPVLTVTYEVTS